MAEKYRGILPPDSIWYKLPTSKASTIIMKSIAEGQLDPFFVYINTFTHETDLFTEILAPKGQTEKIEKIFKQHGEEIKTFF